MLEAVTLLAVVILVGDLDLQLDAQRLVADMSHLLHQTCSLAVSHHLLEEAVAALQGSMAPP